MRQQVYCLAARVRLSMRASGQKTSGNAASVFRIRQEAGNPGISYWLSGEIRKATSGLAQYAG